MNYKLLISAIVVFVAPVFVAPFINYPFNSVRFLVVSLLLLGWLLRTIYLKKQIYLPPKPLIITMTLFYVWNVLSCFWALNIGEGIYESGRVAIGIIAFIYFYNHFKEEINKLNFIKTLIVITLISCGHGFYQFTQFDHYNAVDLYGMHALFSHKNIMASGLFIILAYLSIGLFTFDKNWKVISIVTIVITSVAFLLLQTRSVFLGLFTTALMLVVFYFNGFSKQLKIAVISLSTAFILVIGFNYSTINTKLSNSESLVERIQIWNNTVSLIKENPIVGVGAGNWQFNYSKYSISDITNIVENNISFQRPHNDFLWMGSELGLVGILLVLFIFGYLIVQIKNLFIASASNEVKIIVAFLIGFLVISFFSFPKERIIHIVLIMGLLSLLQIQINKIKQQQLFVITGSRIVLIIILLFNLIFGFYRLKGQYYTTLLIEAQSNGQVEKVIKYTKQAKSIFYLSDITSKPLDTYLGWAYHSKGNGNKVHEYSESAYKLSPYNFEVITNYAIVLLKEGRVDDAKEMLETSFQINKYYESTLINLAVINFNQHAYKKAWDYLLLIDNAEVKYPNQYNVIKQKIG